MNIDRLHKIITLMDSPVDGERLAALAKVKTMLESHNTTLEAVIFAGIEQIKNRDSQKTFNAFSGIFNESMTKSINNGQPQQTHHSKPKPDHSYQGKHSKSKSVIIKGNNDFKETMTLGLEVIHEARTSTGSNWLMVKPTYETTFSVENYPALNAFGKVAQILKDAWENNNHMPVHAQVKIKMPSQNNQSPIITFATIISGFQYAARRDSGS